MVARTTPIKLQQWVDSLGYNRGRRLTPAEVVSQKKGDCLEAAITAAALFHRSGMEAHLMDLRSVRDEDHVLAVYRQNGRFGAVAKSKFLGLKYRSPVYSSLRELAMSYFEHFYNYGRQRTLRAHSGLFDIRDYGDPWCFSRADVLRIEKELDSVRHFPLIHPSTRLALVEKERAEREILLGKK